MGTFSAASVTASCWRLSATAALCYYKKTRSGDRAVDRAACHVLRTEFPGAEVLEFSPWGYDERQFASPGNRSADRRPDPVAGRRFSRIAHVADNPDLLSAECSARHGGRP